MVVLQGDVLGVRSKFLSSGHDNARLVVFMDLADKFWLRGNEMKIMNKIDSHIES